MAGILEALRQVALLSRLSETDRLALAVDSRLLECAAGELILGQEDRTRDVFFVIAGRVRVTVYAATGREVSYRDLGAGRMFGELSAIDGRSRSASVLSLEPVTLVRLSAATFRALLQRHPELAMDMLARLVGLVRALSQRVLEFSTLAVRHRVYAELLRLAREEGVERDDGAVVCRRPKDAELASRVSTHREAITREMIRLARSGVIERTRQALVIPDPGRLYELLAEAGADVETSGPAEGTAQRQPPGAGADRAAAKPSGKDVSFATASVRPDP